MQAEVLQEHAVWQTDEPLADFERPFLGLDPQCHVGDHLIHLLPEGLDLPVLLAVDADDAAALVFGDVDRRPHGALLQRLLELLRTHAVAEAQHTDLADEALVLGDVLNGDVVDHRRHQLVHVLLGGERVDDIHLLRQPCEYTRFDLCRVGNHDHVALRGQNRAAKLATALQVLQVHLVPAGPAVCVRTTEVQQDRQLHAVASSFKEPVCTGLADGGLHLQTSLAQRANLVVAVLHQILEGQIGLGEGVRQLARRWADLLRELCASCLEQACELVVRHQVVNLSAGAQQRSSLGAEFVLQLGLDTRDVDLQHRVAEHAHRDVDQAQLIIRHVRVHVPEDSIRVVHVVDRIAAKLGFFVLGQLHLVLGVGQRVTLDLATMSEGFGHRVQIVSRVVTA